MARHPLAPDWPLELLSTATFVEHAGRGGGTVVTVEWTPLNASTSEREAFEAGRRSMHEEWSGTLDQLADCLAKS